MAFDIRPASTRDIAAVDQLLARSYPRLLRPDYGAAVLHAALPLISRAQPELVSSGSYYVVEEAGTLLGAGGMTHEAPGLGTITKGLGHIRHVVTDNRATRRGVGRALLGHIFAIATAQGLQRLACTSTLTAVPFYRAMGFTPVQRVMLTLAPGVQFPAVQMSRSL